MEKFTGSLKELTATLEKLGVAGQWAEIDHGHQFRSKDGAILNWYPSTGRLLCQGNRKAAAALIERLDYGLGGGSVPQTAIGGNDAETDKPRVFIVHGHDTEARDQLELIPPPGN